MINNVALLIRLTRVDERHSHNDACKLKLTYYEKETKPEKSTD